MERRGLPEEPSGTGKSIRPSPLMANTASTSTPSLAIHVHVQSQHAHKQEIVNPSHDSIANLRKLSDSLSTFQRCFTELHQHIDSIRATIHSVLPLLTTNTTLLPASSPPPAVSPAPALVPEPEPEPSCESDPSEEEEEVQSPRCEEVQSYHSEEVRSYHSEEVKSPRGKEVQSYHSEEVQSPRGEEVQSYHSEEEQSPRGKEVQSYHSEEVQSPHRSELESLCKFTDGCGLRRYMVMHLSNLNRLLEEVPKALRLSRNPARLILECMGKFYFQGGSSYTKGSHMVRGRKASVLVLECFLLMRTDRVEIEIEKGVKEEAEKAALAWRKRLIAEGGVRKANEIDARGLLLLIGCFGIPGGFRNDDIRDLLQKSYIRRISGALRRSNVLMDKIPEIVEEMVKQNMEVDAVHIAYTFGIEDRFNPQRILTSFLLDSEESLKKMKDKSQGSLAAAHEAKRKHLFALTSVIKILKLHDIDPSKLLPAWKINEKIMALEKEIGGFDKQIGKRMAPKRKNDETESSRRSRNKEARRSRIPPWLRQQRVDDHIDINTTLLEGRTTGHLHGYTVSSSVLRGPAAGSIHENVSGSLAGTVGGVAMGGAGGGTSASAGGIHGGISTGTDVVQQGGLYAGGHGGTLVDSTPGQRGSHTGQLYGRRGDAAVYDGLASCSHAYRPSSYLEGSKGLPNSQLSDAYRPPPYLEGSVGLPNIMHTDAYTPPPYLEASTGLPNTIHSDAYRPPPYLEASTGLPNTIHSDAYRPPPYLEGSTGLPNTIPGDATGRSSASGIYQVADTVTASELYMSSGLRAVDAAVSSAATAHPSSFFYWPR